jgi:hypothetical protein
MNKKRFGLFEAALAIIGVAVLGLLAAPSVARHIERGRQAVRMEIVPVLYHTAQDRLLEMRAAEGFDEMIASYIAEIYENEEDRRERRREWLWRQHRQQGLPDDEFEEEEEEDFTVYVYELLDIDPGEVQPGGAGAWGDVVYISKPGRTAPAGLLAVLFDPDETGLDEDILTDAILIEFDTGTGIILSLFYGDRPDQSGGFVYLGDSTNSVLGPRGTEAYAELAIRRSQGHYGAQ